jgi:hypothetical protein
VKAALHLLGVAAIELLGPGAGPTAEEVLALEQGHSQALLRQHRCSRDTRYTAAHHDDISL